jgi:hypothetical protein
MPFTASTPLALRTVGVLLVALGLAVVVIALDVFSALAQQGPSTPAIVGGADTFQSIAQVFTDPRCYNCHGGTDPFSGLNHGGGVTPRDNETCISCHVDAAKYGFVTASDGSTQRVWRMAPEPLHIAGKSEAEICGMLHNFEALDTASVHRVADHVAVSKMVLLAFEGKRAGASVNIDPPPGTLTDLVQQARDWDQIRPHCSRIELDPPTLDYGNVPVGDSRSMNVTVTNRGPAFAISSLIADAYCIGATCLNAASAQATSACAKILQLGDSCLMQVSVTPNQAVQLEVVAGAHISGDPAAFGTTPYEDTFRILGSVTGVAPAAASATSLQFGDVTLQQHPHQTVTVTNHSTVSSVSISNARIVSPLFQDAGDFQLNSATPAGCASSSYTIAPGGGCVFDVLFSPDDVGNRQRWLAMDVKGWPEISVVLNGTGVALPTSSLSTSVSSIDFGKQRTGTQSSPRTITVTNPGKNAVNIASITLGGTYIPFSRTHNCPPTLVSASSCTIDVIYSPNAAGVHTSTLRIYSDAPASPTDVALTGVGLQPAASISPTSLSFGTIAIGTTASRTISVSNIGNDVLTIGAISVPTGFTRSTNCGSSLGVAATCNVVVTFAPPANGGTFGGVINISTDSPGSPHQVTVEAVAQGPKLRLSATTLDFGPVAVSTTSPAQSLTLTNDGLTTLTFTSMTFLTDFASPANTCGSGIAPSASCTVDITFQPLKASAYAESAWLSTNAPGSPHEITLKGIGGVPQFSLGPATLAFGSQTVGTTSVPQTVTVSNTGIVPVTMSSFATNNADFGQNTNCPKHPASLAVGSSCAVNVMFTPIGGGNRVGQLVVTANSQPATQWLGLSGLAPSIDVSPTPLSFGSQGLNTTGATQIVTVTNRGNAPFSITGLTMSGSHPADFSIVTETCTQTQVAPERSCTVSLAFRPTQPGGRTAELRVAHTDLALANPVLVPLGGTGMSQAVALDPSSADFGSLAVGSSSDPPRVVSLTNNGSTALTLQGGSVTGPNVGDFVIASSTCSGATLSVGSSCSVGLRFRPGAGGSRSATLVLTAANGATYTSALTGIGLAGAISLTPTTLQFSATPTGVLTQAQSVELRNTGNASLTGLSVSISGTNAADFVQSSTCTTTLAPAAGCMISVRFHPQLAGTRTAALEVSSSIGKQVASLMGTGLAPAITLSQSSLVFGSQAVGVQSATQSLTLVSSGSAALSINSLSVSGDFALVTHDCSLNPGYQPAGTSCTITLRFTPTASGQRSGVLSIATNAAVSPSTVSLTGTGT